MDHCQSGEASGHMMRDDSPPPIELLALFMHTSCKILKVQPGVLEKSLKSKNNVILALQLQTTLPLTIGAGGPQHLNIKCMSIVLRLGQMCSWQKPDKWFITLYELCPTSLQELRPF